MVDPRDIRIVETTPGGARRSMTGPQLAEEEYSPQGVSSIGEAGAIDMTGVGEFKVCYPSTSAIFLIFVFEKQTIIQYKHAMLYDFRTMKEANSETNLTSYFHAYPLVLD